MMTKETSTKLLGLVLAVKDEEQRLGYAIKERLLAVAEYIASDYCGFDYSKTEYTTAIILLAKYHMAPLADRIRGKKLIAQERSKAYEARCSHCGLPISSRKSLETGLGIICRKKVSVGAKAEKKGA